MLTFLYCCIHFNIYSSPYKPRHARKEPKQLQQHPMRSTAGSSSGAGRLRSKKTKNTDRQIYSPYKPILLPSVVIIITIVHVLLTFLYYCIHFNICWFLRIYLPCYYVQGGDYGLFFVYFGAHWVARGVILTSFRGSFWSFCKCTFLGRVLCETGGSPGHS